MNFARKCDKCQRFSSIPISHPEKLTSLTSPWPFAVWEINLIGLVPTTCLTFKYAVVAVDYFTKWAEAKSLAVISSKKVQEFIWESIICHFDIPHEIVSNNKTQFDSNEFCDFCNDLGIKKSFSSVDHPQTNGQVKALNKIIKFNLNTKLKECKGLWAEELPKVLWAYRTTSQTSTRETLFSLAYGVEAMIPVEVGVPSLRHETYNQEENFALQRYELDLVEEKCDLASLRIALYKWRSERYFNSKVKERRFKEGDLVLRKINSNTKKTSAGVLGPN